ncbi:MAG: hypothetical protein V4487_04690, partial [Chlamydiota bacterium]
MASSVSFPLMELFPQKNYGKDLPLEIIPHYLIALGQPVERIIRWLDNHPKMIDHADPTFRLTPLALSVMTQQPILTDALLKRGARPFPSDRISWTPLHYATLTGNKELRKLLKRAAKINNLSLPKVQRLRQILNPVFPQREDVVCHMQNSKKEWIPITAGEFPKYAKGARSYSDVFGNQSSLIDFWKTSPAPPENTILNQLLEKSYSLFKEKPHKFALSFPYRHTNQIVLMEDAKNYDVLGFLGGEINLLVLDPKEQFAEINSTKTTNLAAMIPDGLPNCFLQTLFIESKLFFLPWVLH